MLVLGAGDALAAPLCMQMMGAGRTLGDSIWGQHLGASPSSHHHPTPLLWQPDGGSGADLLRSQGCGGFGSWSALRVFWQCLCGRVWHQHSVGPELPRAAPARGKCCTWESCSQDEPSPCHCQPGCRQGCFRLPNPWGAHGDLLFSHIRSHPA